VWSPIYGGYVSEHLGDPGAALVVDETGDVKKGTATVGAAPIHRHRRPDRKRPSGGVLAYAARAGHTLIDRRLYLPKNWCEDPQRRAGVGVPDEVEFATKPALATQMITAALDAGMPAGAVAGDEVYGADPELRQRLQQRGIGYVLGIGANRTVSAGAGAERVDVLTRSLPRHAWQHRSAGVGAKGDRWHSQALIDITDSDDGAAVGQHHLLDD